LVATESKQRNEDVVEIIDQLRFYGVTEREVQIFIESGCNPQLVDSWRKPAESPAKAMRPKRKGPEGPNLT
jgi:hypothetical protein